MEGIYVHANRKSKNEDALYYGVIVFLDGGDYNAVSFNAYRWPEMIMLAENKYGLKLHPKVYFCSESEIIYDIDMHCIPCNEKWKVYESDRDVRVWYCPVCDKNPDSGRTNEQDNASYYRAVERFKTTILKLPTKGGE